MGKGIIYQKRMISSSFKASIQVQANPSATVIASLNGVDYSAIADATTGIASIEVQKQGTYTLSSDCAAATLCSLNDEQVTVEAANAIVEATYVKLNRGYTTFDVNNTWGSNTLIPYWDGSAPSEYCDGYQVEEVVSDGNTVKYTGFGETYAVNTTTNIVGYKETVTLGTSKTYQLKAYITINGVNYYRHSCQIYRLQDLYRKHNLHRSYWN